MSALTDVFTAIANAIRGKNGLSTTYKPNQMAQAITDIPSGASLDAVGYIGGQFQLLKVTDDGTLIVLAPYPFYAIHANATSTVHGLVYNNEGNRDEFLIGDARTNAPYALYRIKADGTLESVPSTASSGCKRLRKLDMGTYTSYPKFYYFPYTNTNQDRNKIIKSSDGVNWVTETMSVSDSSSRDYTDIAFSPTANFFIALPWNDTDNSRFVYRKGDSSTWVTFSFVNSRVFTPRAIAYGNKHFVIVGSKGTILVNQNYNSTNVNYVNSWTIISVTSTHDLLYVDFISEISAFVIGGVNGTFYILNVKDSGEVVQPPTTVTMANITINQTVYDARIGKAVAVGTFGNIKTVKVYITESQGTYTCTSEIISHGVFNSIAYKPIS